jgi:hypothetical protein
MTCGEPTDTWLSKKGCCNVIDRYPEPYLKRSPCAICKMPLSGKVVEVNSKIIHLACTRTSTERQVSQHGND